MEESKYYVPELEEFHVGFEYEILEYTHESPCGEWMDYNIYGKLLINNQGGMHSTDLKVAAEWIKKEHVRVKYLDRDDIESLGWCFIEDSSGSMKFKQNTPFAYEGNEDMEKFWHLVLQKEGKVSISDGQIFESWDIFYGTIRNKSELRKVMKMLGIDSGKKE